MIKQLFAWFLVIIGSLFSFFFVIYLIFQSSSSDETIGIVVLLIPFLLMIYYGIKMVKRNKNKILNLKPTKIEEEDVLLKWEISGKDWEAFKEKKSAPSVVNRYSLLFSVIVSALVFIILYQTLIEEEIPYPLVFDSIFSIALCVFLYKTTKKQRNKIYGHLYDLKSGSIIISHDYIDFSGTMIPINAESSRLTAIRIEQLAHYNVINFHVYKYGVADAPEIYSMPIPFEKIAEANEMIPKIKKW